MMTRLTSAFAAFAATSLIASSAFAVDTLEAFDKGLTDVEMTVSAGNLNLDREFKTFGSEIVLGAGLPGTLNLTAGLSLEGDGYLNGVGAASLGLFSTVVDTEHFDLDVMLNGAMDGSAIEIAPGFELNVDSKDELAGFGFFTQVALPLTHRDTEDGKGEIAVDLKLTPGVYYSLADRHQVLVGTEMTAHLNAEDGQDSFQFNSVELGYNVFILRNLELLASAGVAFDQGKDEDKLGFQASFGFIATLPSVD